MTPAFLIAAIVLNVIGLIFIAVDEKKALFALAVSSAFLMGFTFEDKQYLLSALFGSQFCIYLTNFLIKNVNGNNQS